MKSPSGMTRFGFTFYLSTERRDRKKSLKERLVALPHKSKKLIKPIKGIKPIKPRDHWAVAL